MSLLHKRGVQRITAINCLILFFLLSDFSVDAQHITVSTNALQWASLGTMNANAGISVSRHFSLEAGARYNPFTFHKSSGLMLRNKQTTAYAGVRWWPWYVFSGWWISGRGQYSKFSETGIWRYALNEGTGIGMVISGGYTLMISRKINIEFSVGGWAGQYIDHKLYHCPLCKEIRESGPKQFIALDDVAISVVYMF